MAVAVFVLAGCAANDSPITRAAGSWPGSFHIDNVDGKSDATTIQAEALQGNLEIYVTDRKFRLDMTARHQQFSVLGKWSAERGGRVTMNADNYSFENPSEEDQTALGLKIITPDQIRAVFGRPLVLDESTDRRRLTGLMITLGRITGRFEFQRPIPH